MPASEAFYMASKTLLITAALVLTFYVSLPAFCFLLAAMLCAATSGMLQKLEIGDVI